MITFNLISSNDIQAGEYEVELEISSDDEPDNFEESFALKVNGFPVDIDYVEDDGVWTVTATIEVIGPQNLVLALSATDNDGAKESLYPIEVQPSFTLRQDVRTVWSAYIENLANFLPEHTKARGDQNSVYRQLMNEFGLEIDKIKEYIQKWNEGLLYSHTRADDPAWTYSYRLGLGERFSTILDASGETLYKSPSVWGYRGYNKLPSTGYGSFYEFSRAFPERYIATEEASVVTQLTHSVSIHELGLLGEIILPEPDFLYYDLHSLSDMINLDSFVEPRITLEGEGPFGLKQNEMITLMVPGVYRTNHKWKKIKRILAASINGLQGEIVFYSAPPRLREQVNSFMRDKDERIIFSRLEVDGIGSYLNSYSRVDGIIVDALSGQDTSFLVRRQRLLDVFGDPVVINDIGLDINSYLMVGISNNKLYFWDRRDELPERLSILNESTTSPQQAFFVEITEPPHEEDDVLVSEVMVFMDTPSTTKLISEWNWTVVDSDGLRVHIDADRELVEDGPHKFQNPSPASMFGIDERNFAVRLEGTGTWTFELTVEFYDGSTETYSKAITIVGNKALAEYDLPALEGLVEDDASVDFRLNGQILVASRGRKWTLRPQFDGHICDFNGDQILFHEHFDKIEVNYDEQ